MKNSNHLIGGISGMIEACLYLFGFAMLFSVLQPAMDESASDLDRLTFIFGNKALYQTWIILIYVVFGVVLLPLTIAIQAHFKEPTIWVKTTPVLGFIWSGLVVASGMIGVTGIDSVAAMYPADPHAALTSWRTIEAIQYGLGGGVEIMGGLWVLLISIVSMKQAAFHTFLNYFGLFTGFAGIVTIFPPLADAGAVFGLAQIVWFIWIGIVLIRHGRP